MYSFWILALGFSVYCLLFLHEIEETEGHKTFIELTEDQAFKVVLTWYLTIFGFGWFGLNMIRVFCVYWMAKGHAKDRMAAEREAVQKSSKTPKELR